MSAGSGSSRRPAFRVLAMTPMMVTSGGGSCRPATRARRPLEDAQPHARANRILAGRPELRRGLVDDRDAIAAPDLRRIEHPAAAQRNAERRAGDRPRPD